MTDTAVIIFTKAPIPGSVKTRLCPPLTPDEAASLHGTLVLDTVERTTGLSRISLYVACAPDKAHPFFKVLEGRYGAHLLPQEGEDLGARMHGVVQKVFELGHSRVILTGTDLPTLSRSHFTQAIEELRSHDIVLGPTLDGGYYLIGLCRPAPDLFQDIDWSTAVVLEETRKRAAEKGRSVALLPALSDLDDLEDLKAFVRIAGRDRNLSKRTEGTLRLLGTRLKQRGVSMLG